MKEQIHLFTPVSEGLPENPNNESLQILGIDDKVKSWFTGKNW